MDFRDKRGRYASKKGRKKGKSKIPTVLIDHNYVVGKVCDGVDCRNPQCTSYEHRGVGNREGWKVGRRLIELEVLLSNLKYCQACRLGPVPLTYHNIVGEMQKGLSGYLYVECQNIDCRHINRVAYGKTHHKRNAKGMPSFDVNTKLGTGKI